MSSLIPSFRAPIRAPFRSAIGSARSGNPLGPPLAYSHAWFFGKGLSADGQYVEDCITSRGTPRDSWPGVAYQISAANHSIGIPSATVGDGSAITIAFEFSRTPDAAAGWAISKAAATPAYQWGINVSSVAVLTVTQWGISGATYRTLAGPTLSNVGSWHKIVVALSTAAIRIWVDGVLYENTSAGSGSWHTSGGTFRIGERGDVFNPAYGKYANVRVWHSAFTSDLTASQWSTLVGGEQVWLPLNKPNCVRQDDISGNNNHGTIANYALSCHYYGADVPRQPMNLVGYSSSAAANYIAQPNDFSHADWTKRGGTVAVVANQEYHPVAGTLTADRIDNLGGGGTGDVFNANHMSVPSLPAGLRRRSVWIKRVTTSGTIVFSDPVDDKGRLQIDLAQIGGNWIFVDSAAAILPTGVTRISEEKAYSAGQGGLYFMSLSGSPLSFYVAEARLSAGYLPQINAANPAQDVDGNTAEFVGEAPIRPRVKTSNCLKLDTNQFISGSVGMWNTDGTQPMQIRLWVKTTDTDAVWLCHNTGVPAFTGWSIATASTFLYIDLIADFAASNYIWLTIPSAPLLDNRWHELLIDYNGSKSASGVLVYIDGIRQVTTTLADALTGSLSAPSATSRIGTNSVATSQFFNGTLADLRVTIGGTTWRGRFGEGGGATGCYINDQFFPITNAGSNWTETQDAVNVNFRDGFRGGPNLLLDSIRLSTSFSGSGVSRTEVGNMPSGAKILQMAKTSGVGSSSWNCSPLSHVTPNNTQMTLSLAIRATATSSQASFGIYQDVAVWSHASVTFSKISGPGTVSQAQGALIQVTGLSLTEWTYVRVTATIASGASPRVYFYPDTHNSTTSGATVETTEWQLELGGSVSPWFATKDVSGLSRVPPGTTPLVAANGLPLNRPAGNWHNAAESKIDWTGEQPLNPAWNGLIIPTDYSFGDTLTAPFNKRIQGGNEDRFNILVS